MVSAPSTMLDGSVSDAAERRKRIVAIVGASSGNLVEWYDFYAYAFTSIYFASAFFPAGDPTASCFDGRHLRGRLLHAAARRLAVRLDRRPARPADLDGDLGAVDVRRLADDRRAADLCGIGAWRRRCSSSRGSRRASRSAASTAPPRPI